ncbi:MAG: DUF1028 domain-containing protein [Caldilineaceae bacterium]|nr:DUF1028 domain-containing protein [Caldilineaceae bacterium]
MSFPPFPQLAHTYSIVAFDSDAQELGVAVQSHYFSTGSAVPWLKPGVGAVATQSYVEIGYGPLGLELMQAGKSAQQALDSLLVSDPLRERRQVAMVDMEGNVAVHTGSQCIAAAGHRTGKHYSVQANLMARDTVWDAMAVAFEAAEGDLASRMLAALEAAEAEGGDIRGRQSAALVVIDARPTGQPWNARRFDLRVDDHGEPLVELRRLLTVRRAYLQWNAAGAMLANGEVTAATVQAAKEAFAAAPDLMPENVEGVFWFACALANAGRVDDALPYFRRVYALQPVWRELVPRLAAVERLPTDRDVLRAIQNA